MTFLNSYVSPERRRMCREFDSLRLTSNVGDKTDFVGSNPTGRDFLVVKFSALTCKKFSDCLFASSLWKNLISPVWRELGGDYNVQGVDTCMAHHMMVTTHGMEMFSSSTYHTIVTYALKRLLITMLLYFNGCGITSQWWMWWFHPRVT